ncbi:MAG: hypothetical protein E7L01_01920 [Paenibacillus macerans]|uniref:hypothetical protein n=1 Tax=Paenibacillus TaxID=44249 RepID=UPI002906C32E|nr:hypothetical protein [Paenibacillus macerans]MDU7472107.1 hypothetical protein [Paenibacillus macerans]
MTVTVYQYVFADRDKTCVHTTLVNDAGAVLDRNIATYAAYPLKQIADEHAKYMLRVLKRSLSPDHVIYDCNIRGRVEYTATDSGFSGKLTYHPRRDKAEDVRLQWADPEEDREEMDE